MDRIDLSGRAAIVTGAASGIGLAIAEELASHGARVLCADLDTGGEQVAARLGGVFQRCDVSSREDCRAVVDRAVAELGRVDILVNNAGLQHVSPIEDFPEDRWEHIVRVMLFGAFYLTKYVIPHMYERGWGRIVNISSLHGLVASPYKSAYIAAKHGLNGLTKTVALEAAEKGVTVTRSARRMSALPWSRSRSPTRRACTGSARSGSCARSCSPRPRSSGSSSRARCPPT